MTDRWHGERRRGRRQEHRSQERSVQGILQWNPGLVSQPHAPKFTSSKHEVESPFYFGLGPQHVEIPSPGTRCCSPPQQLKLRGVNVFLGMEPKCTSNYGLKDSMNLGHTTLSLQQNSHWHQSNLCASFTRQLPPVCIKRSYYADTL